MICGAPRPANPAGAGQEKPPLGAVQEVSKNVQVTGAASAWLIVASAAITLPASAMRTAVLIALPQVQFSATADAAR